MSKWIVSLFLFISAAVFLTVAGQSTTGVDDRYDDQLANAVAILQAELAKLAARNEKLEKMVQKVAQQEHTTLSNGKCCFLMMVTHLGEIPYVILN